MKKIDLTSLPDLLSIDDMAEAVIRYDNPNITKKTFADFERECSKQKHVIRRALKSGRLMGIQRGKGKQIRIAKEVAIHYLEKTDYYTMTEAEKKEKDE